MENEVLCYNSRKKTFYTAIHQGRLNLATVQMATIFAASRCVY